MTPPTDLPPAIYEWPAGAVGAPRGQVLRQFGTALQTRSGHQKHPSVTCWHSGSITFEEYNTWRHEGDQQRKATRTDPPAGPTALGTDRPTPATQSSAERSRAMR